MPYATPRDYANAVRRYTPGTPEHRVAAARAVLAYRAVQAHQSGDYSTASKALEGLGRLATFGEIDTAALSRRISSTIATNSGRLSPDARAIATGERVSGTIAMVSGLVGGIVNIIGALSNDPGVMAAARWLNLIVRGDVSPSFSESELRAMASMCSVWTGGLRDGVRALPGIAEGIVAVASGGRPPSDAPQAIRVVREFADYVVLAFDTICTNLATVFPPATLTPTCGAAGSPPRPRGGVPLSAAGCCAGLVFDSRTGTCVTPTPATPDFAARTRFQRAWTARRDVEAWLSVGNDTQKATARARDASTAAELCAAGQALLAFQNPLPAMPRAGVPAPINTSNVLTVAATLYSPPSTQAYCSIAVRPEGGCPVGCTAPGAGGGGGGAGIFAVALPAAALVWYMMQ